MPHNKLSNEASPYLLQHKDNPVWWQPWGEEAFRAAKDQNKLIFLSVGYSTCHWCHVMEHESFEGEDVARILNDNYISIKVDREERPDVDDIYMRAVQAITGQGGWPMSVWLTPDLKPFYGGTYFPKTNFMGILNQIQEAWKTKGEFIIKDSEKLATYLNKSLLLDPTTKGAVDETVLKKFFKQMGEDFDVAHGGFGPAPKFPASMQLMSLMRISRRLKNKEADIWIHKTLQEMARRGMYDHANGGFHRYSTDTAWVVPHFEKMLYDNALLSMTYLEAYQLYKSEEYRIIAQETLDYVLKEMTSSEGGFYSAQDADSLDPTKGHKEEGYFATWNYLDLKKYLSKDEFNLLDSVFFITEKGNFEGKNHLVLDTDADFLKRQKTKTILSKLSKIRAERPQPHLDNKIITAWNGLMIASLSRASRVLNQGKYYQAAEKAADFVFSKLMTGSSLNRHYAGGKNHVKGFSDDYTAMIHACIELYQSRFDEKWYKRALDLQKTLDKNFWDNTEYGYFKTDGTDKRLIARNKPSYDGVQPSNNSLAAYNLLRLYHLSYDEAYNQKAQKIFSAFKTPLETAPRSVAFLLMALDLNYDNTKEVAIVGEPSSESFKATLREINSSFTPNMVIAKGPSGTIGLSKGKSIRNEKTTIYVCENKVCQFPTDDIKKATEIISSFKRLD